jgi:hypothetical protein
MQAFAGKMHALAGTQDANPLLSKKMNPPHQRSRGLRLGLWFLISVVLGVIACTIPWGPPDRFHGTGFPIPVVMWDKPPGRDHLIDYPNIFAIVLNPLLFFIVGLLLWTLWRMGCWAVRWLRS